MKEQGVVIRCGSCERTRKLLMPQHSREEAALVAGILDGTSPIFVHGPKPDRSDCLPGNMGRCAVCNGVFTCSVFGYEEPS